MELSRHSIPASTYPSPHLEGPVELGDTQTRLPLSEAAGNSQIHAVASTNHYEDNKGYHSRVDVPLYSIPTVPSQPASQAHQHRLAQLNLRRQHSRTARRQQAQRYPPGQNPILESSQYQAYRQRQTRDGNENEAKWPEELERAFLDALIDLPRMGRRKFSMHGKPHGRNELIQEYLWISYKNSLPPGAIPDKSMKRTRKQVSSHIQVLKGFLKDHPSYERLFPPRENPKNGFEDSFKHDPCLIALAQERLPRRRYDLYESMGRVVPEPPMGMKPVLFWLLLENDDKIVIHNYTRLSAQPSQPRQNLESIPNWRQKFPQLEQLYVANEINCEIIHMQVTLELSSKAGSKLSSQAEISIPGRQHTGCNWQTVTSLIRPPELCKDLAEDPPLEGKLFPSRIHSVSDVETNIRVRFEPIAWAHILSNLTGLKRNEEAQRATHNRPIREYVEQISMYQDVQSWFENAPVVRRGIILWTLPLAEPGEGGLTTWRYVDASPSRNSCMSPLPTPGQHFSANMNENFHSMMDNSFPIQHHNVLDTYAQGLATPPSTGGLQSPFGGNSFNYPVPQYEAPAENLSFMSGTTVDSGSTLEHEVSNMDNFLSNTGVTLSDYGHNGAAWDINQSASSFDAGHSWAGYGDVATHTPPPWETDTRSVWTDLNGKQPWMDGQVKEWTGGVAENHQWAGHEQAQTTHNGWDGMEGLTGNHDLRTPGHDLTSPLDSQPHLSSQDKSSRYDYNSHSTESPTRIDHTKHDKNGHEMRYENHSTVTNGRADRHRESFNEGHSNNSHEEQSHLDSNHEMPDHSWEEVIPTKDGPHSREVVDDKQSHWNEELQEDEDICQKIPPSPWDDETHPTASDHRQNKNNIANLSPDLIKNEGRDVNATAERKEDYVWIGSDGFDYTQLAEHLRHDSHND